MTDSKIYHFTELDSTNEYAKKILNNTGEWTVVVADKQKCGKGRFGKSWYSPEGGLWFSIILRPRDATSKDILALPLVAGVAVCDVLKALGLNVKIKWPNDILVGSKKIAGILTEYENDAVILGVGINLNISEFPKDIEATSTLLETGKVFDKNEVLKLVLDKIDEKYNRLQNGELKNLLNEWRSYSITLGEFVEVKTPNSILQGKAIDIDEDGALLVELPSGNIERVLAGECSLMQTEFSLTQ
ncbi:MAG: biotin--[acetyl-CoA-carboxylase] ligase [bacterium]|nr:biotin--[acetyl-CoA-carboxylase] ligase [bacterium]